MKHDRIRDRERDGARAGPGGRAAQPGAPAPAREEKKPNLSHFSRVQISTPCSTRQSNRQAKRSSASISASRLHTHVHRTCESDRNSSAFAQHYMPREAGPEPHAWLLAQEPRDHPDDSTALSLSLRIRRRWPPAAFMPGMKAAARVGVVRIAQLSSRRYTPSRRADQRSGW